VTHTAQEIETGIKGRSLERGRDRRDRNERNERESNRGSQRSRDSDRDSDRDRVSDRDSQYTLTQRPSKQLIQH
jgi:hypothetical protein